MKSIYSLVALIIFGSSSLVAQQENGSHTEAAQPLTRTRTGAEMIEILRHNYENNAYDAFLANLNADYQQMVQSGKMDEFAKMRETLPADQQTQEATERWESIHQKLIAERNEELNAAVVGKNDELIYKRIHSITTPLPADQKEAIHYIVALRFKTPSDAINADEQKLIEIDLASEFKIVHLDTQYTHKSFDDQLEKNALINMDSLHQMLEASQSFKDSGIRKKIELAAAGFDRNLARNWDLNALHQMMKKPSNDVEKKIAAIFVSYREKANDLYQKEFLAKISDCPG